MADTATSISATKPSPVAMIARIAFAALAFAAISWGAFSFHESRQIGPVEAVAKRITYGDPFKTETLAGLHSAIAAIEAKEYCQPTALRAGAIIRLREFENAVSAAERIGIDDKRALLRESMLRSLSCAPADSFLWLVLYWTDMTKNGFNDRHLDYLRMSYRTGPNEAWVALRRSRLALAAFPRLPPDLANEATDEFVSLVATRRVYPQAVAIMQGPGWPIRDIIVPKLARLPENTRQDLSNALDRAGLEIDVPGIARRPRRPWH
jgi:hypothetical protein